MSVLTDQTPGGTAGGSPYTGESVEISAPAVSSFKAGKALRDSVA